MCSFRHCYPRKGRKAIAAKDNMKSSTSETPIAPAPEIMKIQRDALEWHEKLGHPSAERQMKLSHISPDVPCIPQAVLRNIHCPSCSIAKAKRAPFQSVPKRALRPLELVHMDVLTSPAFPFEGISTLSVSSVI